MSNTNIIELLKTKRDAEERKMQDYNKQINEHVDRYGWKECDYLNSRRANSNYHRGRYNICVELLNELS